MFSVRTALTPGIAENNLVDVDFKQMEKVNRSEGETYAQDLITAHPNLGAIFCHSEDPAMAPLPHWKPLAAPTC